jgi:hypothetical protein
MVKMKKRMFILLIGICFDISLVSAQLPKLSKEEVKQGWVLLFNGQSSKGWEKSNGDSFPSNGWVIKNGELSVVPSQDSNGGGDIVTIDDYADFELMVDFKIAVGANSGIKYFFTKYKKGGMLGLEYQILDDAVNPDAKLGINGNRLCGSFYDMIPPSANRKVKPVGEWNTARIISKGKHVEHWLNGVKIVEFDRESEAFIKALTQSKYKDVVPSFGSVTKGRILLQDHGSEISFRNIKIKKL